MHEESPLQPLSIIFCKPPLIEPISSLKIFTVSEPTAYFVLPYFTQYPKVNVLRSEKGKKTTVNISIYVSNIINVVVFS